MSSSTLMLFAAIVAAQPGQASGVPQGTAATDAAQNVPPRTRQRPFISPLGEPFVPDATGADPMEIWFRKADQNGDGALTVGELQKDAQRFFATLDKDADGEIAPDEMTAYEQEVAAATHAGAWFGREGGSGDQPRAWSPRGGMGRGRGGGHGWSRGNGGLMGGGMGGASLGSSRFGLLDIPQPVAAADANLNRGVSLSELENAASERFVLLDTNRDGRLTLEELKALRDARRSMAFERRNRRRQEP